MYFRFFFDNGSKYEDVQEGTEVKARRKFAEKYPGVKITGVVEDVDPFADGDSDRNEFGTEGTPRGEVKFEPRKEGKSGPGAEFPGKDWDPDEEDDQD